MFTRKLLAAALALCLASAPAVPTTIPLTGAGKSPAVAGATLTFAASATATISTAANTSVDMGAGGQIVLGVCSRRGGAGGTLTVNTIGGQTATQRGTDECSAAAGGNLCVATWTATGVASGAQNINSQSTLGTLSVGFFTYVLSGNIVATSTDGDSSTTAPNSAVTGTANGAMVMTGAAERGAGVVTHAFSNAITTTDKSDLNTDLGNGVSCGAGHANAIAGGAITGVDTFSATANAGVGHGAVFQP